MSPIDQRPPHVRVLRTALQVLVGLAALLPAALAVLAHYGVTVDGAALGAVASVCVLVATTVVAVIERAGRAPVLRTAVQVLVAVAGIVPAVVAGLAAGGITVDETGLTLIFAFAVMAATGVQNLLEGRDVIPTWNPGSERHQLARTDNGIRPGDGIQPDGSRVAPGVPDGPHVAVSVPADGTAHEITGSPSDAQHQLPDIDEAPEVFDLEEPAEVMPRIGLLGGARRAKSGAGRIRADVAKVLAVARSQDGVSEAPPYSNRTPYSEWYGLIGPWCAMFVSWVFWHAGYPLPAIRTSKGAAYCPDFVNWAKRNGCWHGPTVRPNPGWLVLFDFPGDGVNRPSHIGIVERVLPDGRISTWEGNTSSGGGRDGGSVVNHYRSVRGGIIGYVQVDHVEPARPPAKPARPATPARRWRPFRAGATDASLARVGGELHQVTEVQMILTRLAEVWSAPELNPGPVDGIYGPRSQAAVSAFKTRIIELQKAQGRLPWPNTDSGVGPATIDMLRWWNR